MTARSLLFLSPPCTSYISSEPPLAHHDSYDIHRYITVKQVTFQLLKWKCSLKVAMVWSMITFLLELLVCLVFMILVRPCLLCLHRPILRCLLCLYPPILRCLLCLYRQILSCLSYTIPICRSYLVCLLYLRPILRFLSYS